MGMMGGNPGMMGGQQGTMQGTSGMMGGQKQHGGGVMQPQMSNMMGMQGQMNMMGVRQSDDDWNWRQRFLSLRNTS